MTQEFVTLPREVVEQISRAAEDFWSLYKQTVASECVPIAALKFAAARSALRAALEQPQGGEKQPDWLKLDKPARVGGGSFGVGTSSQHVVMAAQRAYEENVRAGTLTHEQMVEEERNRRALWDLIHGSAALKQPQVEQEPVAGVVIRDGLPCLLQDKHIKSTDHRVYAHPQPKREPLTDEQIMVACDAIGSTRLLVKIARAIEAAHNIK